MFKYYVTYVNREIEITHEWHGAMLIIRETAIETWDDIEKISEEIAAKIDLTVSEVCILDWKRLQ